MKLSIPRVLALLAAASLAACADAMPETPLAPAAPSFSAGGAEELDGSYLVAFSRGVPAGFAERVAALGGTVTFAHGGAGVGAVAGLTPQAAAQLRATGGVTTVIGDDATVLAPFDGEVAQVASSGVASPDDPAAAVVFGWQWHLGAIGAPTAWAAGRRGSPDVRVAILDSGIGYLHPDLAGRVDLAASRSFVPSDDALVQAYFPGAHPVADIHFHGTHVSATVSSNALVAAGVTSQVTLVGVKVCGISGLCPVSNVLAGLLYATDLGVDVANLSLGALLLRRDLNTGDGPSLMGVVNRAFNYAHRKGTTVVAAAGNFGVDLDHNGNQTMLYCEVTTVICVSATGPTASAGINGPWTDVDALAPYSNYGRSSVSVAAPGGARSPVWAACSPFSLLIPVCQGGSYVAGANGTSMAAPHASGTAALIVEDVGRDPARVRARLQQTADDLGEPGTDPKYGKGRINAARAVGAI
jgi:lantibiotic leader peptide-processing serine protease